MAKPIFFFFTLLQEALFSKINDWHAKYTLSGTFCCTFITKINYGF